MQQDSVGSFGTTLKRNNEEIGEILSLTTVSLSRDTDDITLIKDDTRFRKYIGTLRDGGTLALSMLFDYEKYGTFWDAMIDRSADSYEIDLPDGSIFTFKALVSSCAITSPIATKVTADINLKITGTVTFEEGV